MPLGYKERLHKLELELTEKCTADGAWVEPKGNTLGIMGLIGMYCQLGTGPQLFTF